MGSNQETLGILERLVAGSLAGVMAQSSIYPMEVQDRGYTRGVTIQQAHGLVLWVTVSVRFV